MAWNSPAHAVRIVSDDGIAPALENEARTDGAIVIKIDLDGLVNLEELDKRLAQVFRYPHQTVGFDAAIDLMSDLEWMPSARGYLLRVAGSDAAPLEIAGKMAGLLPAVIDRWRTQLTPFVAIVDCQSSKATILDELRKTNEALDAAGRHDWNVVEIGPVPVIVDGEAN